MTSKQIQKSTQQYFHQTQDILGRVDSLACAQLVQILWQAYLRDQQIFFAGNGGSASAATHLASDIGKNTIKNPQNNKEKRFKTFSLTDNVAWITALGNDLSYSDIFVEQLKNFGQSNDVLFVISASGNSPNVLKAATWAKNNHLKTVGLLGFDGGKLKDILDTCVIIPIKNYGIVEAIHGIIHHYIVDTLTQLKNNEQK